MVVTCRHCDARVILGRDGSCPACGRAQADAGPKVDRAAEAVPLEVGPTVVSVFAKFMRPSAGPLALPNRCACCGTSAGGRSTEVPIDQLSFVALPSCRACELHLRPRRQRALYPFAVALAGVTALWGRATEQSTPAVIAFVPAAVLLVAAVVLDRRSRTSLREWVGARDGHCGPVTVMRVGRNYVLHSQHRSWLREVEQLNRDGFDTKIEIGVPAAGEAT